VFFAMKFFSFVPKFKNIYIMKAFNEQGCILLKCLNMVFFEFFYDQHPHPSKKEKEKHQKGKKTKQKKKKQSEKQ